jgi:hypothetical protein
MYFNSQEASAIIPLELHVYIGSSFFTAQHKARTLGSAVISQNCLLILAASFSYVDGFEYRPHRPLRRVWADSYDAHRWYFCEED